MLELQEDIMQRKLLRIRYSEEDYGGPLFIRMQKSIVEHVMCVKGLENLQGEMKFPLYLR